MIRMPRFVVTTIPLFVFLGVMAGSLLAALAQSPTTEIPANAKARSFGGGWDCVRGYRKADGACVAITVPANAYATRTSYGSIWECNRGYRKAGETCTMVVVPANGYLNTSGDG